MEADLKSCGLASSCRSPANPESLVGEAPDYLDGHGGGLFPRTADELAGLSRAQIAELARFYHDDFNIDPQARGSVCIFASRWNVRQGKQRHCCRCGRTVDWGSSRYMGVQVAGFCCSVADDSRLQGVHVVQIVLAEVRG